jgi:hypothetical protein
MDLYEYVKAPDESEPGVHAVVTDLTRVATLARARDDHVVERARGASRNGVAERNVTGMSDVSV